MEKSLKTISAIILSVLSSLLVTSMFSCSSDDKEDEDLLIESSELIGCWCEGYHWNLDSNGEIEGDGWIVRGSDSDYVRFSADGTFTYGWDDEGYEYYSGTYKFDNDKNIITLSMPGFGAYERWEVHELTSDGLLVGVYDLQEKEYLFGAIFYKVAKLPWE